MKIKICGLFREADAMAVNNALPDYAGFVFAPGSRRRVDLETALSLRRLIDARIETVGVFRDAPIPWISSVARSGAIGAVQLHGCEDAAYIRELRKALCAEPGLEMEDVPIIKAISVKAAESIETAGSVPADMYLFDNGDGGTGECFDASLFRSVKAAGKLPAKPVFIAGGVTPENIGGLIALAPDGIDVSSGAETDGVKDAEKILALVNAVRGAT